MSVKRYNLASALVGGLLYAAGGYNNDGGRLASVEAYNPATNSLAPVVSMTGKRYDLARATFDVLSHKKTRQ